MKVADFPKATSESETKSKLESRMCQRLQKKLLYFQTKYKGLKKRWGDKPEKKWEKENQQDVTV